MSAAKPRFVSYSANREDVLINRLFSSLSKGCFVDVGAGHPLFENDTKALYDRGWTGINIEPQSVFFQELAAQRPNDRNFNVAISNEPGPLTFHEVVGTGLSTCDPAEAQRAAERGFQIIPHQIGADTLRNVLDQAGSPTIDLLKVDVEGFELKVLESNDWARFRPSLIVVEATFPETPQRRPDLVTPFLMARGYRRVYFDGLNDYFVEQSFDLPETVFASPPGIFDHFVTYTQASLSSERDDLAKLCATLEAERDNLIVDRDRLAGRCGLITAERDALAGACSELKSRLDTLARRRDQTITSLEVDLKRANAATIAMRDHAAALAQDLDAMSGTEHRQVQALLTSTSWRVTQPLRDLRLMLNARRR